MISISKGSISIPQTSGQLAVVDETAKHFNGNVHKAYVTLSGYRAEYVGDDHHVKLLKVNTKVRIVQVNPLEATSANVIVTGELQIKDVDNAPFTGSIYYTLFVDYTPTPIVH